MKKILLLFAIVSISVLAKPKISEALLNEYEAYGFEEVPHEFGGRNFKLMTEEGLLSHVHWPKNGIRNDPEALQEELEKIAELKHKGVTFVDLFNSAYSNETLETCARGDIPDFWKFFGKFLTLLNQTNTAGSHATPCFKENNFTINFVDNSTVEVIHSNSGHQGLVCGDAFFYSTMQNFHFEAVYLPGTHKVVFKDLTPYEMEVIRVSGIWIYRYCDSVINLLPDFLRTLLLFDGGHGGWDGNAPNLLQEEQCINMIYQTTGYQWKRRANDTYVALNQSLIKNGDFLAVTRFIGNDAAIELGTGSHAGHSTMALWQNDTLYILESQGGHWPKQGLQATEYSIWMGWAQAAGYQVAWLPLASEYSAIFNADAVWEWFNTVEGQPYGYENFLWGWVDTANDSFPGLLDPLYLASFFAYAETVNSNTSVMFNPSINWRLGTKGLNVSQMAIIVAQQGLNFPDLYAMVEEDFTMYGDHYSFTCSAFVTELYKQAGLFGDFADTINGVEWTPRDIYQSVFIDPNPVLPDNCKAVDPNSPFCQIMGRWQMEFQGYSTVDIYPAMNQHCPSVPPLYERTPGC